MAWRSKCQRQRQCKNVKCMYACQFARDLGCCLWLSHAARGYSALQHTPHDQLGIGMPGGLIIPPPPHVSRINESRRGRSGANPTLHGLPSPLAALHRALAHRARQRSAVSRAGPHTRTWRGANTQCTAQYCYVHNPIGEWKHARDEASRLPAVAVWTVQAMPCPCQSTMPDDEADLPQA